ncbi:uncharacterized protein LOC134658095 [Cydia amplana]|uniref:uncharacterized protein LOC134658095 n=1 Tax=Cydia amplana TaxID=1869771 RepID=UPI002FE5C4AF
MTSVIVIHDASHRHVGIFLARNILLVISVSNISEKSGNAGPKIGTYRYFMHDTYMEASDVAKGRCLRIDLPAKISKKERLVILHAGGKNGLISGTFTTIKADYEFDDHFSEVNTPKFEKWVTDNLKDKFEPNSVICISSPRHHSIQKHKKPKSILTTKTDMQNWLKIHNVEYKEDLEKIFLLQLISKTRSEPVYAVDEALKSLGHTVLRIPPIHADLNPLEYVWEDIRKKVADSHGNASVDDKRRTWMKLYSEYPLAEYQKWVDLVKNTENEYYDMMYKLDEIVDDIIGRYAKDLNSDSEDWTTDNSEESESDSDF